MRVPSRKSIVLGTGWFVAGFATAIALTYPFVNRTYGKLISKAMAYSVPQLLTNERLLKVADQQSGQILATLVSDAQRNSISAAVSFDGMGKNDQRIVLRQFARMNDSPTLRADKSRQGDTALLARFMVLCTHRSARPQVVKVGKRMTVFANVPGWVLDASASPRRPIPSAHSLIKETPEVLAAEYDKWKTLHEWVITNQGCIARHSATH